MTDDRDPLLQKLFAEARQDLAGEQFTAQVMAKTKILKYRNLAGGIAALLVALVLAWLFALPLQEFAQLITRFLAISLLDLGDSWLAWLLSPINNVASVLVICGKGLRVAWKKIRTASYAY